MGDADEELLDEKHEEVDGPNEDDEENGVEDEEKDDKEHGEMRSKMKRTKMPKRMRGGRRRR